MRSTGSSVAAHPSPLRKRWLPKIKICLIVVVVMGLGVAVRKSWIQWQDQVESIQRAVEQLDARIESTSDPDQRSELEAQRELQLRGLPGLGNVRWGLVGISALIYAMGLFPPAWLLCHAVRWMGQTCKLPIAIAAQIIGHLGKYVPGKAMVVVMRVGVLNKHGVTVRVGTAAVFMETLLMMAVGGFLGALLVWRLPVPGWIRLAAVLVACVSIVPTLPPVMSKILRWVQSRGKHQSIGQTEATEEDRGSATGNRSGWQLFGIGWISSCLAWVAIMTSFSLLVSAIPGPHSLPWYQIFPAASAAVCLAIVLGFVSLIPGGMGVRELVLTAVLAPVVGVSQAMLAAISARMLYLLAECLCVAISWTWLDRTQRTTVSAHQNMPSSEAMS